MPKRKPSGSPRGRGASSPRANSAHKSFTKKSGDKPFTKTTRTGTEKPFRKSSRQEGSFTRAVKFSDSSSTARKSFQKSDRNDSADKPSVGRSEGYESGKKRGFSEYAKDKRPNKKFDHRASGSKSTYNKDNSKERRPFPEDSKGDKPYKKFDKKGEPRQNQRRDSFPGASKEERPYKFDRTPTGNRSEFHKGGKPAYRKRGDSFSSPAERPIKKFNKGDRPYKPFLDASEKPSGQGGERGVKPRTKFETGEPGGTPTTRDSEKEQGSFKKEESIFKRDKHASGRQKQDERTLSQAGKIRLNKFIANSGVCSRREADELIKMSLISVNGKTITEMGYKVNPGDEVRHESKVLRAEKPVYILLNKPKGFLTTTVDPQERNTVMHLIGNVVKERVYPVGRLDRNTTGLLLLTNDGDLAEKLMHPSYNVKKIYKIELDRPLTKADAQRILEGVKLEEGRATVDDLAIISDDRKTVGLEIHIGWNRVVRRIFEALEYNVIKLDRSVYAGLNKKDIGRGQWRFLKKEELVLLKHFQ
jgi:23S rRNA pseudouridine2605 synthase